MNKSYCSADCNLEIIKDKKFVVVGYGIQGRAQALNLRDSGMDVVISNIDDKYKENALADNFKVINFDEACKIADITLLLIPDSAHLEFINTNFRNNYKKGSLLSFAHGYSLRFEDLNLPNDIDIAMIAPRYPGQQIRDSFIEKSGVPAFIDVVNDFSSSCLEKVLGICKAIGFSEAGVLSVGYKEEAEVDLYIEQFMAPLFYSAVENSIKMLNERGYSNLVSCLELYFSGELGAVRSMMAKKGMYTTFKNNASPTCQFGVANSIERVFVPELKKEMINTIDMITDGTFKKKLKIEEENGYQTVKNFFKDRENNLIAESEKIIEKIIKRPL